VTDWDERERQIRKQQEAQQAALREEQLVRQRAVEAACEERYRKLSDVAAWAIKRYRSAGVAPVPIYSGWDKETGGLFRELRTERRTTKVAEAYPLIDYTVDPHMDFPTNDLIMTATSGEIFSANIPRQATAGHRERLIYGGAERKIYPQAGDPGSVVVTLGYRPGNRLENVYEPFDRLVDFLTPGSLKEDEIFGQRGIDEACDAIVRYVMNTVDRWGGQTR
jgi:hypothetical protein